LGRQLGSDVPFFIHGTPAWVEGTGEQVTPVAVPERRYIVAKPPVGLSTAQVFNHPALTRDTPALTQQLVCDQLANNPAFGHNDLQPVAQLLCPELDWGLKHLTALGLPGRMTGSGSAMFAQLAPEQPLPSFPTEWFQSECWSLSEHPLFGWIE
jgi:4-diphosphocytidyl-2-C-methyl-D-erythritol kinase